MFLIVGAMCAASLRDSHIQSQSAIFQKKPHVRNFCAHNSGAGNGSGNFMGAWHFLVLSENPHAQKIRGLPSGVVQKFYAGASIHSFPWLKMISALQQAVVKKGWG